MPAKILTLLTAAALAASASAATTFSASSAATRSNVPHPRHVVSPTELPRWAENMVVTLEMTVDQDGVPRQLRSVGHVPNDVLEPVKHAVAQWRFAPRVVDGKAVSTRIQIPIQLVADDVGNVPPPQALAAK